MTINYELKNGVYGLKNGVYADSLVTIVSDFEDGDISEYTGSSNYSTDTGTVHEGSYSLYGNASSSGNENLASTSGLPNYPGKGDTFACRVYMTSSTYACGIYFGVLSESFSTRPEGYIAELNTGDSILQIVSTESENFTSLASVSQSWSNYTGAWIDIEVNWASDDTITVTVYDSSGTKINSVSVTDTTFATETGVGFWERGSSSSSEDSYFDYYRITG